jgi:hypothetical protein
MVTPEEGLQTRLVSKRDEINVVDDGQRHCSAPIVLRDRA